MSSGPVAALLADGRRLHLQHGPIDLVIEAFAEEADEIRLAYAQARTRFANILSRLVDELAGLRTPVGTVYPLFQDPVARRMAAAVWPHRARYITPMAAVAGSVAEEILAAMLPGRQLKRAYVNNGGDIALHLTPGEIFRAGIVDDQDLPDIDAVARIEFDSPVRGVATSGWRGRSQSLGIADAVTVLADSASAADAAATMVANAVNVEHQAIRRIPACELHDDSDLGRLPVTIAVGALPRPVVRQALSNGAAEARSLQARGLLRAAYLSLQGEQLVVSELPRLQYSEAFA